MDLTNAIKKFKGNLSGNFIDWADLKYFTSTEINKLFHYYTKKEAVKNRLDKKKKYADYIESEFPNY